MESNETQEPASGGSVTLRALFIDDSPEDVELVLRELSRSQFLTTHVRVDKPQDFRKALTQGAWDIVLCDYSLRAVPVQDVITQLLSQEEYVPVVVVSGYAGEEVAVSVMQMGARDYVCKDNLRRLSSIVHRELAQTRAHNANRKEQLKYRERLRLASKLEALGQLAAGVAHEINTPMQYISDNLSFMKKVLAAIEPALLAAFSANGDYRHLEEEIDLAQTRRLLGELPEALDAALDGTQRVARIVDAMKGIAHPGGDTPRTTDILELVRRAAVLSRTQWKRVAELDVIAHDPLPSVACFADELGQALINVMLNAAHAIEDAERKNGRIEVHVQDATGGVEIRIIDNGIGMSDETRARIFDPFFTTKAPGRGTGQGLSQVYMTVVKQHGGDVDVASQLDKGTIVSLFIPSTPPAPRSSTLVREVHVES